MAGLLFLNIFVKDEINSNLKSILNNEYRRYLENYELDQLLNESLLTMVFLIEDDDQIDNYVKYTEA